MLELSVPQKEVCPQFVIRYQDLSLYNINDKHRDTHNTKNTKMIVFYLLELPLGLSLHVLIFFTQRFMQGEDEVFFA